MSKGNIFVKEMRRIGSPPRRDMLFFKNFLKDSDKDGIINAMDYKPNNKKISMPLYDMWRKKPRRKVKKK